MGMLHLIVVNLICRLSRDQVYVIMSYLRSHTAMSSECFSKAAAVARAATRIAEKIAGAALVDTSKQILKLSM